MASHLMVFFFLLLLLFCIVFFFFFNDTATTEIYTLSLHDALPISFGHFKDFLIYLTFTSRRSWTLLYSSFVFIWLFDQRDRKSTRLNSSHSQISYAVFCLKKKKITHRRTSLY